MPGARIIRSTILTMAATLVATLLVVAPAAAAAAAFSPDDIVFPVAGPATFTDDFGDPRSGGRLHQGIDLMTGQKGVPIVAAAAGTVTWIGASCCYLAIDHGNDWETWYIHLNNDTPGTDDGKGWGIAPGIVDGTKVAKGQLIGWSGDSGNAEATAPHLHFEIRKGNTAINPYKYLLKAPKVKVPAVKKIGNYFVDDNGSVHEANIDELYRRGITKGCNPPANDRYCPGDHVSRGHIAAFLRRHLDLPASSTDHFVDDDTTVYEGDINALADAGIAFGCTATRFCPDEPLRREEMAEMLVRTFAPEDPARYTNHGGNRFTDDASSPFEKSINRLFAAGVTKGCNPPDNDHYCPTRPLSRAEMATFLVRALD